MKEKKPMKRMIGFVVQEDTHKEIVKRAKSMSISRSQYCRMIIENWLDSGNKLKLSE